MSLQLVQHPCPWQEDPIRTLAYTERNDPNIYFVRDSVTWQRALRELTEDEFVRLVAGTINHEFLHLVLDTMPGRASTKLDRIVKMTALNEDCPTGLYGLVF